jgi:hypothetical protein
MNALSIAAVSLVQASDRFDHASRDLVLATSGASDADPAKAIVSQAQAKTEFSASVGVLRVANEMFKSLLDIKV